MKHTEVFRNVDGSRVQIDCSFTVHSDKPEYRIEIWTCGKGKRTFEHFNIDSYEWRRLDFGKRAEYKYQEQLKHCTQEQIDEVKMKLWQKLKP